MNLAFLSSSPFTIDILQDILNSQKQTLEKIFDRQISFLRQNQLIVNHRLNITEIQKQLLQLPTEVLKSKPRLNLIISQPDRKNRKKTIANPISKFARENNIKLFTPNKINQECNHPTSPNLQDIDLAITASFGQIISSQILNLPKFGFINWHPSLLPKYRGATPMQTVIANGETETGLSWIEMVAKMDAGEILLQTKQNLSSQTDFFKLADQMANLGSQTWAIATLSQILKKTNPKQKISYTQDGSKATFSTLLNKQDALVDPNQMTAQQIFNHYRAYQAFPKTSFLETEKFKQKLRLDKTQIFNSADLKNSEILYQSPQLTQVKINKTVKTLLNCKNQTYLELQQATTEQGKRVNFSGINFYS